MMQLTPVEDKTVPTFRTNGDKLWYNPDYMATLDDGQLRTILAHEVLHPALLHPFRLGDRDLRAANIAADYAINNFLDRYNQDAVKGGEAAPFPWPKRADGEPDVLLNHAYDEMSFEEIYAELTRKPPEGPGQQPPAQNQTGTGQRTGQPGPNGKPADGEGDGEGETSSSPGEFSAGSKDQAEVQAQEAKWKIALRQAAVLAKGEGRLPADMQRLISELLEPKASWREILRTLLTSAAKDDYTWTRPNCRYSGRGVILPSLHVPRMGTIAVAIDTSGSIDDKQMAEFMAEVRAILFDCRPEKLILIGCDADVHDWHELDPFDEVPMKTEGGGGGTDFCPVFERLAQLPEPPAALVYLTDLCGSAPDLAPAYPVIWACINEQTGPFGETIHL
jgi:predicted metal-dependent peptidase